MDIRTKLALALVSVSLASMILLGTFAYRTSADLYKEIALRQLDALAESKRSDLLKVFDGWKDQVRLMRAARELGESVVALEGGVDADARMQLSATLDAWRAAVSSTERITLFSTAGAELISVGRSSIPVKFVDVGMEVVELTSTSVTPAHEVKVAFHTWLTMDGVGIGTMEVVMDASDLESVTADYTGLGETGETFLVRRAAGDSVMVLNRLRHDDSVPVVRPVSSMSDDVKAVLGGADQVFPEHLDYRNILVWSAGRFVEGLEWGVIVKVDKAEEEIRSEALRDSIFDLGIALSAFAIIGGTLLGFWLAKPIQELADLVHRVRDGETNLRADADGQDEVAYLAQSLNAFLDTLAERTDQAATDQTTTNQARIDQATIDDERVDR